MASATTTAGPDVKRPRISLDIADGPTQRLYVVASLVLLQAFKLAEVIFPPSNPSGIDWDQLFLGSKLMKWISFDLAFVAVVIWLRVPRFDAGWRLALLVRLGLVASDYLLFGTWKLSAVTMLVPSTISSMLSTSLSTTERSVRLSSVIGDDKAHLGGEYTVHILAVSTAHLDTSSLSKYCLTSSSSETIHLPLVINNTLPSKITYSIKKPDSDEPKMVTISGSDLIKASSSSTSASQQAIKDRSTHDDEEDDVEATLASWGALVPTSASGSSDPSNSASASSSSEARASSESLYYIPIEEIGQIRLESVHDAEGSPIKIRRRHLPSISNIARKVKETLIGEEDLVKIVTCPRAGFKGDKESHICAADGVSWDLGLSVKGKEPLSVRWYSREGELGSLTSRKVEDGIEGIVSPMMETSGMDGGIIDVPMNVSLSIAAKGGRTTFFLDRVKDASGNEVTISNHQDEDGKKKGGHSSEVKGILKGMHASRTVVVHRPPEVSFVGVCGKGEEVKLLRGKTAALDMRISGIDKESGSSHEGWSVLVRFTPEDGEGYERNVTTKNAPVRMNVNEAGTYELVSVSSQWCEGSVLVPSSCTVVTQPLPSLSTTFKPLLDVCDSPFGSLASLTLTGHPPFVVHYDLISSASPNRPTRKIHRIAHSRDELRLEPPGPGEWEYRFVKVADQFYPDGIELPANDASFRTKQKIGTIGDANWANAREKKVVHSCEGETLTVEVELKGTAPWEIEYSIVGSGQKTEKLSGITNPRYSFEVQVPSRIAKKGGRFALSLESVKDANGCRRALSTEDLIVDVQRTKPTARFHGSAGSRSVSIRDDEHARIPLRLTGEPPWTITYQPPSLGSTPSEPLQFTARGPNADMDIRNPRPGTYRLLGVRDLYCPGDVSESEWTVSMIPRPTLQIAEGQSGQSPAKNGSIIRRAVCENVADAATIKFEGKAPFKASYTLIKGGHSSEKLPRTLASIQSMADLTLFTGVAGHHTYAFNGVGDAVYSTPVESGLVAPTGGRSGIVRIEQDVHPLPSAKFAHGSKHGLCVKDKIESRASDDLILHLEGTPPFNFEIEVKDEAHRNTRTFAIDRITTHEWAVKVPFQIDSPTPHSVSIRKMTDAHGCEREFAASASTLITIPVAEIASITPVLPTVDACVGEYLDFVVQGAPPFTVKYEFEGKQHSAALKTSTFRRLASAPGLFKILSVGHEHDQCRSNDVDLVKHIHPLPSASVSSGDSIVVDIREGDQTEIVFNFTGTPPFSFTYSRRKPQDRSKDKTVLETHTVVGIMEHRYSILTSQEGTWSVSYISDSYCSWPPRSTSSDAVVKS